MSQEQEKNFVKGDNCLQGRIHIPWVAWTGKRFFLVLFLCQMVRKLRCSDYGSWCMNSALTAEKLLLFFLVTEKIEDFVLLPLILIFCFFELPKCSNTFFQPKSIKYAMTSFSFRLKQYRALYVCILGRSTSSRLSIFFCNWFDIFFCWHDEEFFHGCLHKSVWVNRDKYS